MSGPLAYVKRLTGSEPTSPTQALTQEWDETIKTQLGLGILQALDNRRVVDETHRKRKSWNKIHTDYQRKRLGLGDDKQDVGDDMANVVRIDSPDTHYHVTGGWLSKLLPWVLAGVLGTGAAVTAWNLKPTDGKPTPAPVDTDTNLTIEGH